MPAFVVLTTAPDRKSAARLARLLVRSKAAACVNVLPGARSVYRWKGKIEESSETILVIKAPRANYARVERLIRDNHPYDVPEVLGFPVPKGSRDYLRWLHEK